MDNKQASLVEALCRHREILRRETTFLRREVTSRNLATMPGKRAYLLETQSYLLETQSSHSQTPQQQMTSKVNLPYLVGSHEQSLDLLLHEADQLRYRIQSLASILREFPIIICSEKKAKMMYLMSQALVAISRHIIKSSASADKEGEASSYQEHRAGWESTWGCGSPIYGFFDDITTLSPMHFTRSTPGIFPLLATTCTALQIYSIEIVDVHPILGWPLHVYGVVAARDTVDRNRNLLFYRSRANCQKLTQDDPYLHLTGPSRAILAGQDATQDVIFEVELKIKYGAESQHTAALSCDYRHWSTYDETPELCGGCCTVQISLEHLHPAIQATIIGVQVVEGGWPFNDGGRVSCFLSSTDHREVVLLDCRGGETPVGSDDYFRLSRNVVTAESQETLRVVVQGYSEPGGQAQEGHVDFRVKYCQISEAECFVGNSKVKVVVAWSLLVRDKEDLVMEGYVQA